MEKRRVIGIVVACMAVLLPGCAATVGAGAATGGVVTVDRRTAGSFVDDELIELKALQAISNDEKLWNLSHIDITSYNNIVLLSGETPSEALRRRAETIARGIQKVRSVHNELTISAPSSMLSRSRDTLVTAKVKTKMLTTERFPGPNIKVVTERGTVFLMGLVSHAEADVATDITRQIRGVRRVVRMFEYLD